ncbi:hypothetical protein [Stenotrophomonas rhizophila]|uniref:hypothetical protein n=1 Tax=Stenotrophomonas rhizophila TaxID=216778 RepID=UPI0011A98677|nr:hypothetical protein [Stenotrophomonas rhizophila]
MRNLDTMEVNSVAGGELNYSLNLGPVGISGTFDDLGQAAKAYGRFAPFSGIAYVGDLYDLYNLMAK